MENKKFALLLSAIGVPYSVKGKIDSRILPEDALCSSAPIFYDDAKASSLTYTLLKNNYDLFDDQVLSHKIGVMNDKLAIAMLGGILHKSNKKYFHKSIETAIKKSHGFNVKPIRKTLSLLADVGQIAYDSSMQNLFGIKINKIEVADFKKTLPREAIIARNVHFESRSHLNSLEFIKNVVIELTPKNSVEKIKRHLCEQFVQLLLKYDLKQKEVAHLVSATPAQVNEITKYKFERFTVDFLIEKMQLLVNSLNAKHIAIKKIELSILIQPQAEV